jgi:hypothetical protein
MMAMTNSETTMAAIVVSGVLSALHALTICTVTASTLVSSSFTVNVVHESSPTAS